MNSELYPKNSLFIGYENITTRVFGVFCCIRYVYITIFIRKSAALGGGKNIC